MNPHSSGISASRALKQLNREFPLRFGANPSVFRAPGRVNLIGEHTDYNEGFVLPVAMPMSTFVGVSPRAGRSVRVHSLNLDESAEFKLDEPESGPHGHWSDYVRGVARVLMAEGVGVPGADLMISSEVPIGAGLSSSASLEVACALALLDCAQASKSKLEVAQICQRAEHEYARSRCGIMDQYVACFGGPDEAILLDCRSLTHEVLELSPSIRIIVCNSKVKHHIAASEYNRRRSECEEGVSILGVNDAVKRRALRDFDRAELEIPRTEMPAAIYRRCRHVISENRRVLDAASALKSGDLPALGALMYESHASLRNDFVVSCEELDLLVDIARGLPGVYGARMTGGGFGGCTVNIVAAEHAKEFESRIKAEYASAKGFEPDVYV